MVVGIAVAAGLPLPLLPLQILFLNLVTDVFPAFALAMGEGGGDVMRRPPRDPQEPIVTGPLWTLVAAQSFVMTLATLAAMALARDGFDARGRRRRHRVVSDARAGADLARVQHGRSRPAAARQRRDPQPLCLGRRVLCLGLIATPATCRPWPRCSSSRPAGPGLRPWSLISMMLVRIVTCRHQE